MSAFAMIILGVLILLLGWMLREAFLNNVVRQELTFDNFPKTFGQVTIFFIADIHRRKISGKIIDNVAGKADLVVIGGDLTEKGVPLKRVKDNLEKLRTVGPVYFVWGNNDYEGDYHKLDALLQDCQVKILDNTAVIFESEQGEKISLLGVDDLSQDRDRLDLALLDAEQSSFKILACHYPEITEKILPEYDISLVLSGHTHGGQIHILGYSPFERGRVEKRNNTTILISNGYGTTSVPLRLGAPAECHLLTIKNNAEKAGEVDNSPTNADNIN